MPRYTKKVSSNGMRQYYKENKRVSKHEYEYMKAHTQTDQKTFEEAVFKGNLELAKEMLRNNKNIDPSIDNKVLIDVLYNKDLELVKMLLEWRGSEGQRVNPNKISLSTGRYPVRMIGSHQELIKLLSKWRGDGEEKVDFSVDDNSLIKIAYLNGNIESIKLFLEDSKINNDTDLIKTLLESSQTPLINAEEIEKILRRFLSRNLKRMRKNTFDTKNCFGDYDEDGLPIDQIMSETIPIEYLYKLKEPNGKFHCIDIRNLISYFLTTRRSGSRPKHPISGRGLEDEEIRDITDDALSIKLITPDEKELIDTGVRGAIAPMRGVRLVDEDENERRFFELQRQLRETWNDLVASGRFFYPIQNIYAAQSLGELMDIRDLFREEMMRQAEEDLENNPLPWED